MKKIKLLKYFALLPLTTPAILPIVSCSNGKVTLTFKNPIKGGTIVGNSTITVNSNTKWYKVTNLPQVQADDGYEFMYWTNNGDKLNSDTIIASNMNITPKFGLKDVPTISNVKKIVVAPWTYDATEDKYVQHSTATSPVDFYNFNNSNVGYISIEDFLNNLSLSTLISATTDHTNHKTIIKHVYRYATDEGGQCIIDYKNQTITFNEYEKFADIMPTSYGPMTTGITGVNYWNSNLVNVKNYNKGFSTVIDLKKYGIEIYEYAEDSTNYKGYIPYEFYKNMFNLTIGWSNVEELKGKIFDFNGKGLFEIVGGVQEAACKAKAKALEGASEGFYNSDYLEYCYNLFALTLDMRCGIVDRVRRSNGEYVKFLEDGAYNALKEYHDDMISTEADKSNNAMRKFFKEKLDDGGHSGYTFNNVFAKTPATKNEELFGDECMWKSNLTTSLKKAREKAQLSTEGAVKDGYKEYTKEGSTDQIAYITFDNFVEESGYIGDEQTKGRELPAYTNESNYMSDTIRLTMYANSKIQSNTNIKDVVVDLSCNGGGSAYTCIFIASWLCGGVTEKIYNPHSKAYNEYHVNADVNGDDVFDTNDYLSPNINLYVITSSVSFSCGNLLPTNIQDCRPNKTTFVGTKSGGGSCYVDNNILIGMNAMCQFSSSTHILRQDAVYGNFIDNESGNTITSGWEINERTDQAAFYDRDALNKRIWKI